MIDKQTSFVYPRGRHWPRSEGLPWRVTSTAILLTAALAPLAGAPGALTPTRTPLPPGHHPDPDDHAGPARPGLPRSSPQRTAGDARRQGSRSGFTPRWTQIGGAVGLQIGDADTAVASFVVPDLTAPTVVRLRFTLADLLGVLDLTLLPAHTVAVTIGDAEGPPGGLTEVDIAIDPLDLKERDSPRSYHVRRR